MDEKYNDRRIAIIGTSCRLPGAVDPESYWRLIRDGISTVKPVPPQRFERELYYDATQGVRNRSYADIACLVDYNYRGPQWAQLPQFVREHPEIAYRVLCEVAAEALAGISSNKTRTTRKTGVYVGHTRKSGLSGELTYATYIAQIAPILLQDEVFLTSVADPESFVRELIEDVRRDMPKRDAHGGPDTGAGLASSLISRAFEFDGPAMTFNSACASSMNALAQAVRSLQRGRIDMAVVGGASYFHQDTLVLFSQARSLSAKTSCPFDDQADGLVVGEGYVAIVLKTLERAERDGDEVLAVIDSLGLSSDGKGKSLWAPRVEGQIEAIRRAYNGRSADVQFVEAHATSTQVGDATELRALADAMNFPTGTKVPLGSVKANVGHTLETAGLAGLLKTVLCLKHATIPAATNISELNRAIPWDKIPFYVPRTTTNWPKPKTGTRRAAVNSFGIGGLNVHVVLSEYVSTPVANSSPTPRVVETSPRLGRASDRNLNSDDPTVVIGFGAVLPGALNTKDFAALLEKGIDPKGPLSARRLGQASSVLAGEVVGYQYDWRKHKIPPKQIAAANPIQFMILDAVEEAFAGAGIVHESIDRRKIGVVVGSMFGGEFSNHLLMGLRIPDLQRRIQKLALSRKLSDSNSQAIGDRFAETLLEQMPALLDETGSFTSSSLASRVTKSFDLMGGGVAVDAGYCSSAAALACCDDQLRANDCDLMVCVGAMDDLGPVRFEILGLSGQLSPADPRSPFDAGANGSVPAEGCGVLLLSRMSVARERQYPIKAVLRGIGAGVARNLRFASESAVKDSWDSGAGSLSRHDVVKVETTSMGIPNTTRDELQGCAVYANSAEPIPVDCVTSQIGHLGGATGVASVIKILSEFDTCRIPQTFGLTEFDRDLSIGFTSATAPTTITPRNIDGRILAAIHNSGNQHTAYHILFERGSRIQVSSQSRIPQGNFNMQAGYELIDGIPHFDATLKRKNAMLDQSRNAKAAEHPVANGTSDRKAYTNGKLEATNGHSYTNGTTSQAPRAAVPVAPAPQPKPIAPVPVVAVEAPPSTIWSAEELRRFLINFVVEQTGYPPDIVEMDADLEADLGIDSIKKAQLFGELREHFDLRPDANLTLDDFPHLESIHKYIAKQTGATASVEKVAEVPPPRVPQPKPTPPVPVVVAEAPPSTSWSAEELRRFLINFVVEQTGYPPEIVEMDADLEADLGIDSIKKAQLFGELREHFDLRPDANLTLDDFPHLESIHKYIAEQTVTV